MQALLHADELRHLAFEHLRDGHARPRRHDLRDLLGGDLFLQERAGALERGERRLLLLEPLLELGQRAVAQLGGRLIVGLALRLVDPDLQLLELGLGGADRLDRVLLGRPALLHRAGLLLDVGQFLLECLEPGLGGVVLLLAKRLAFDLELDPPALELVELDRHRVDLHPQAARGLVDEVDRLVGQEALRDVAVGERGGGHQCGVRDPDSVVDLVALAETAQDRDGLLDRGLVDEDGLEASFQRSVLLDVLAVFVERRCTDRVQLAAGQHRLQQVVTHPLRLPPRRHRPRCAARR